MPEEIITKYALVVGDSRVGKTTLVSGLSKLSRNKSFMLIDGSGCEDADAIQRLIQTHGILDRTGISAVFLVIKYDNRFERMPAYYFTMEDAIEAYADRIVIMVSHFDYSKSPEKDQIGIREVFEEECPNIKKLRCYSGETIDVPLANFMNDCIFRLNGDPLIQGDQELYIGNEKSLNDVTKRRRSGSAISHAESTKSRGKRLASDTSPDVRSESDQAKIGPKSKAVICNDRSSPIPKGRKKTKWFQRLFRCFPKRK